MKLPAFVSRVASAASRAVAKGAGAIAPLVGTAANLAGRLASRVRASAGSPGRAGEPAPAVSAPAARGGSSVVLIVSAAAAGLALLSVLVGILIAGPVRSGEPARAASSDGGGVPEGFPRSGPALASMLLVPGDGERPYPLALEPKARYTEADAALVRPDLGSLDVSGSTRRRKAELEAVYGAVD